MKPIRGCDRLPKMVFSLSISLVLCLIMGVYQLLVTSTSVNAEGSTLFVAPGGDCGSAAPCYGTIQNAIDAASDGDTVKISQGIYTATGFQVVFINKPITLIGGYSITDWSNSYPNSQPTIIDAEDVARRRGIYIDGINKPTINLDGLSIQNGYAENSCGGGIFAQNANLIVHNSLILDNQSTIAHPDGKGAGIYLKNGTLDISGNTFKGNRAGYGGGGVFVEDGNLNASSNNFEGNFGLGGGGVWVNFGATAIINDNIFKNNSVEQSGGGVRITGGTATLEGNEFVGNSAIWGGAVEHCCGSVSTLNKNSIHHNMANWGGGVIMADDNRSDNHVDLLNGNIISDNFAIEQGGGLLIGAGTINLNNNIIRGNTANIYGGAILISGGIVEAQNDMIVENISSWEGIYLTGGILTAKHWTIAKNGDYAITSNGGRAYLTNSIITSHDIGGLLGANITGDHVLFWNNGTNCSGGAVCTGSILGDPHFIDPTIGDYHIRPGSAAQNSGIESGVAADIDDDPRPLCSGYDIGADELVPPLPVASFESSSPDWLGNNTDFTNTSNADSCAEFLWDFGDGTTSNAINPTHTYGDPGTYTVTLTASNIRGNSVSTDVVNIFEASYTSSSPDWLGQVTNFVNNTKTSVPTAFLWSFGDGETDTAENPSHTYDLPGSYSVSLSATNDAGTSVYNNTVIVYGKPSGNFTASPTQGILPLHVAFTSTVTTIPEGDMTLTYSWSFGDGLTSTLANPEHLYADPGIYTVTLTVDNAAGASIQNRIDYISVHEPVAAQFTASPTIGTIPLSVSFTNQSTGDFVSCIWTFGDGLTSNDCDNPTHTYTNAGIYTVSLAISGPGGVDSVSRTGYINAYEKIVADFTADPTNGNLPLSVTFDNKSTGDYTSTYWDFGDGETSTEENPTHTYEKPGIFTVTLRVEGLSGIDTKVLVDYIVVNDVRIYLPLITSGIILD